MESRGRGGGVMINYLGLGCGGSAEARRRSGNPQRHLWIRLRLRAPYPFPSTPAARSQASRGTNLRWLGFLRRAAQGFCCRRCAAPGGFCNRQVGGVWGAELPILRRPCLQGKHRRGIEADTATGEWGRLEDWARHCFCSAHYTMNMCNWRIGI